MHVNIWFDGKLVTRCKCIYMCYVVFVIIIIIMARASDGEVKRIPADSRPPDMVRVLHVPFLILKLLLIPLEVQSKKSDRFQGSLDTFCPLGSACFMRCNTKMAFCEAVHPHHWRPVTHRPPRRLVSCTINHCARRARTTRSISIANFHQICLNWNLNSACSLLLYYYHYNFYYCE